MNTGEMSYDDSKSKGLNTQPLLKVIINFLPLNSVIFGSKSIFYKKVLFGMISP